MYKNKDPTVKTGMLLMNYACVNILSVSQLHSKLSDFMKLLS